MNTVTIHFDGGTPCNNPTRGYGIGYGSFSINGGRPVRVNHGFPCSNNVAEMLTLYEAIEHVRKTFHPLPKLRITGDSQVALKWAQVAAGKWGKMGKAENQLNKATQSFRFAVARLRLALKDFSISVQWLAREHAVRAFGH